MQETNLNRIPISDLEERKKIYKIWKKYIQIKSNLIVKVFLDNDDRKDVDQGNFVPISSKLTIGS